MKTFNEFLIDQAHQCADQIAVEFDERRLQYGSLLKRARQYAWIVSQSGAEPNALILVQMERNEELVAALLGIMWAGCVCVPLDMQAPEERVRHIINEARPWAMFTLRAHAPTVDGLRILGVPPTTGLELAQARQGETAYCIFTSGSTGRPKGVMVPHAGIETLVQEQARHFGVKRGDRVAQFASPAFDAFMFELMLSLCQGATLVMMPDTVRSDPHRLFLWLGKAGISITVLPTFMVTAIADMEANLDLSLHAIIAAGDVLPTTTAKRWGHRATLFNAYGPTEATIWSTVYRYNGALPDTSALSVPIGKPIKGTTIHLLDQAYHPVTPGERGELWIGGVALASGYVGRPELTKECFVDITLNGESIRLYRSGDVARELPGGDLEFHGRIDHQVKVRGFRIELNEIEAVLRDQAQVQEAVVLVLGDDAARKKLVAFIQLRPGQPDNHQFLQTLQTEIARQLPDYMVPAQIITRAELPLNTSGKIDRHALAQIYLDDTPITGSESHIAPRNSDEATIAAIWSDVLGVPCTCVEQSFYQYGGNSISAVQIINEIARQIAVEITIVDFLRSNTIAALAEKVMSTRASPQPARATGIPALEGQWMPTSLAQMQLAFVNEYIEQPEAYLAKVSVRFIGQLNIDALRTALQRMIERHDILRTRFELREGILQQKVDPAWFVKLDVCTPTQFDIETQRALLNEISALVIDPSSLPLIAWKLVRISANEHLLLHVEHHYVHDGWSYRLFLSELAHLYNEETGNGARAPLPPATQFITYCQWQQNWLRSEAASELAKGWRQRLAGAQAFPPLRSFERRPTDLPHEGFTGYRTTLPPTLMAALEHGATTRNLSLFQLMFGAFGLLLSRAAGANDVIIGSALANRSHQDWERMIGMLVNVVPVRLRTEDTTSVETWLTDASEALLDSLEGAELPYSRICEATAWGGAHPLVEVMFSFHSSFTQRVDFCGLDTNILEALGNDVAKFPLDAVAIPDNPDGSCDLLIEFDAQRYSLEQMQRLAEAYTAVLALIVNPVDANVTLIDAFISNTKILDFPCDGVRGAKLPQTDTRFEVLVDADVKAALTKLTSQYGSAEVAVLSAWGILFSRLSEEQRITFGYVHEKAIATLTLTTGSGAMQVSQLLAQGSLALTRARQTASNTPATPCQLVFFDSSHVQNEALPCELALALRQKGEELSFEVLFDSNLHTQASATRRLGQLGVILMSMARHTDTSIQQLEWITQDERHQVLYEWNDTAAPYPTEACIHELFEEQVARTPEAPALAFGNEVYSYAHLNERANRLAGLLASQNLKANDYVAVCMTRSTDMIISILAVLKAGAAYVPMEPSYPAQRLAYMLIDSAPVCVLVCDNTIDAIKTAFNEAQQTWPLINTSTADTSAFASTNPNRQDGQPNAATLAYLIYTSGSTGRPKGVMIEHGSVCNQITDLWQRFEYVAADRVLQFASFTFDVSVEEIFGALTTGAMLVLSDESWLDSAESFWNQCRKQGITCLSLPTRFWQMLIEDARAALPPTLRHIDVGGEAITKNALDLWFSFEGHRPRLFNAYGPTEATVNATIHLPTPQDPTWRTIGRPMANARVYILNEQQQVQPIGVVGEIYIGGAGVARGYRNLAEITAEKFMHDPFAGSGGRMYRTGDLGRWLDDGQIEYLGRNDFQVKIRGFRIELEEIETELLLHPDLREAAVIAHKEPTQPDSILIAYIVPASGTTVAVADLRAHLMRALPAHMIPTQFITLPALPINTNGKLDRAALPAVVAGVRIAPRHEADEGILGQVADLLRDTLPGCAFDADLDFFSLGFYSLALMRVVSTCSRQFAVPIRVSDLFAHNTPRALATLIGARLSAKVGMPDVTPAACQSIAPVGRSLAMPLSSAQQRLWFLAQLPGMSEAYHMSFGMRIRGKLDVPSLQRALTRIVDRHEALRTVFGEEQGTPIQIIKNDTVNFVLFMEDLRDAADQESELSIMAETEARTPFDLRHGPLLRARLACCASDHHVLMLTMHHIVADGWSIRILERELRALYMAYVQETADPLPALPIQYADYAIWQKRQHNSSSLPAHAAYWQETLLHAPVPPALPGDHDAEAQDHAGAYLVCELDAQLVTQLRTYATSHGLTMFMILLAGWAIVQARLTGSDDIVVGTPSANRDLPEVQNLIGVFVNTLAIRVRVADAAPVSEVLQRVRDSVLGAQQYADLPFDEVVGLVRSASSDASSPLFRSILAWEEEEDDPFSLHDLECEPIHTAQHANSKLDLVLYLRANQGGIAGGMEFASARFKPDTIRAYLAMWIQVLRTIADDDNIAVGRLPLMSPEQQQFLLQAWSKSGPEGGPLPDAPLHRLFERQAAATPDAPAIREHGQTVSYCELNERANALAHHLQQIGVGHAERVVLFMPRSIALIVSELAVLKCGSAYVPIDYDSPPARVRQLIDDAAPAAIVVLGDDHPTPGGQTILVDLQSLSLKNLPITNLPGPNDDELPAYIMYTSGSTGAPKGVIVPHRAVRRVAIDNGYADFCSTDRFVFAANTAFDASTLEMWGALLNGACLCVVNQNTLLDPRRLATLLRNERITVLWLTAGLFNQYVDELRTEFAALRYLIVGGDVLNPAVVATMFAHGGPRHFLNGYGPTETTTFALTHAVPASHNGHRAIPLGRPIAQTRVYILDQHDQLAPVGVSGEICIGGAGVALGYLHRPDLTAERFVPDPFATDGSTMYRSGDLGRWTASGIVEFLGRKDSQVKLRGYRIELTEIEAQMTRLEGIYEARVIVRTVSVDEKQLCAYIRINEREQYDAAALRAALRATLPSYMIPHDIVLVEHFPLTPNGKLDVRALPAPMSSPALSATYSAPVGETEIMIAAIWSQLLGNVQIGRDSNFFLSGGHSLAAVRLLSRLREEFDIELALTDVFETDTLTGLAERVVDTQLAQFDSDDLEEIILGMCEE